MIKNFYNNLINLFNNPFSLKDLSEIRDYYEKKNLKNHANIFNQIIIENNKVENNSSNIIS
jgi:hypothetical protein